MPDRRHPARGCRQSLRSAQRQLTALSCRRVRHKRAWCLCCWRADAGEPPAPRDDGAHLPTFRRYAQGRRSRAPAAQGGLRRGSPRRPPARSRLLAAMWLRRRDGRSYRGQNAPRMLLPRNPRPYASAIALFQLLKASKNSPRCIQNARRAPTVGRNDHAFDDLVGSFHQFSSLKVPVPSSVFTHRYLIASEGKRTTEPGKPATAARSWLMIS